MGSKKKRFLVIGLGRFGSAVAGALTDAGHDVMAVDQTIERVDAVKHRVSFAARLDATDVAALRSIDAATAHAAIVAIGGDFEAAVLSVVAAKELDVQQVIARARTSRRAKILVAVGATRVIELEAEMAKVLTRELAD